MQFASHLPTRTPAIAAVLAALAGAGGASAVAAAAPRAPSASAARTVALSETGSLHAATHGASTIEEVGEATGTYKCSITVHLLIISAERVSATFTVRPKGGTVSGGGSASFSVEGNYGYIGGTLKISKGTGVFAHASGRNIGFSGKFNRNSLKATVHVHGLVSV